MKHTAITIGPIIKSLGLAQKTRELWAASYFFSNFMEEIISNLNLNDSIVFPFPDKEKLIKSLKIDVDNIKSAGIFPDRLLLVSQDSIFKQVETAISNAIKNISKDFGFKCNENEILNFVTAHIIEFDTVEDNIVFDTNKYLAICELQANYTAEDKSFFLKMLQNIDDAPIYKNIFKKKGFQSIFEITTQGLNIINFHSDIDDNELWEQIEKENKETFKLHNKYLAIVQADGDSVGEIIKQVAKQGIAEIKNFSEALSSFSLLAANEIAEYKGVPVYTGGDDLLFFAPVTNGSEHIFNLIEKLDTLFKTQVTDKFKTETIPTMSYGISISYYKFPMHEALSTAQNLLFSKAKQGKKNNIAIKIQKHSGQSFGAVLSKPINKRFKKLIDDDKGLVLNSILYQFEKNKVILKETLKSNGSLDAFFDNFYNEDIHNKSRDFINEIKIFLKETYAINDENFSKTLNQVNTQLRIIKFLNATKDD